MHRDLNSEFVKILASSSDLPVIHQEHHRLVHSAVYSLASHVRYRPDHDRTIAIHGEVFAIGKIIVATKQAYNGCSRSLPATEHFDGLQASHQAFERIVFYRLKSVLGDAPGLPKVQVECIRRT